MASPPFPSSRRNFRCLWGQLRGGINDSQSPLTTCPLPCRIKRLSTSRDPSEGAWVSGRRKAR